MLCDDDGDDGDDDGKLIPKYARAMLFSYFSYCFLMLKFMNQDISNVG